MNGSFRQSMAWLHTWSGLLVGWVLFAMFLTGTASYFRPEITRWMEPETGAPASASQAAVGAVAFLQRKAPNAASWTITLPDERQSVARVSWRPEPKAGEPERRGRGGRGRGMDATLDAATGQPVTPRETRGGEFFYRFHFQMHYVPVLYGRWIAGACAMFMLVAIVSGVITHKRIFKDFFTFRPKKAPQRSWLDAHNMTAVLALPFHAMITYTGLVTLMSMYMPWPAMANYQDNQTYFAAAFPRAEEVQRTGTPAALVPLPQVLDQASRTWSGGRPWIVTVNKPGDAAATIEVSRHSGDKLSYRNGSLTFSGVTGELISRTPEMGPAGKTGSVMYGLHLGRFAEPLLRWMYFLCSLAGCAMVATGLVLWTVKRRRQLPDPQRPHFGFRLVEKLNIGTIAGVPAGMAAMLWANRLLPVEMASRSQWEVHAMFIGWGCMIAYACVRPAKQAWVETLSAAALLVGLLPLVNAATTQRNLVSAVQQGDWAMAAFDLTLFALGGLIGFCAWKTARHAPQAPAKRSRLVGEPA
ncbi:MAG: peptidase [Phenylobacterium sp.]|nr:peptidase [Phenylobacterium sp.]